MKAVFLPLLGALLFLPAATGLTQDVRPRLRILDFQPLAIPSAPSGPGGRNTLPQAAASRPAAGNAEAATDPARKALQGKWIVRHVERDGDPNAAQIGQKVGDVITIELDGAQLGFG